MRTPILFISLFILSCQNEHQNLLAPSENLQQIFQKYQEFIHQEFPTVADSIFDHLPSMAEGDIKHRAEFTQSMLNQLQTIDINQLTDQEVISLELFKFVQQNLSESYHFKSHLNPLLVDGGFHISFAFIPSQYQFQNTKDYKNYLKVLSDFPRYTKEHILMLKKGLKQGISLPKIVLKGYETTFDMHVVENPEESIFFHPFRKLPETMAVEDRESLRKEARKVIMDSVVEGYSLFSEFMKTDYMVNTRSSLGASELPNGTEYYQQRIHYYTTLDLSADSIHRLGLEEVARIRIEMDQIIKNLDYKGSFEDFLSFLRTDPQFFADTPDELLKEAAYIAKRMDGQLPEFFGKLPRQPYTVNPVPNHLAAKYTAGRYVSAPINSKNSGQYWVNTYDLPTRTLYTLESLTLHEAVPGHHLQNALSAELDLPEFRRNLYLSAFGEGWGLYSEFLGIEAGFYTDPYSNFGRLTYEMWRACRLVVDTGIHSKGWTRQEVIDYMTENTALSIHEITTETDRYIAWPAQALSYKIGEIKIKQLRKKAEQILGQSFDIREFHDLILSNGTVTLEILEGMVNQYLEEKTYEEAQKAL